MTHLILGIHGFARKPAKEVLEQNWQAALIEGLKRNCGSEALPPHVDFQLVYWADQLHDDPLTQDPEPYLPAPGASPLPIHDDDWIDELVADVIDAGETFMDRVMKRQRWHDKTGRFLDRVSRDCERYNQEHALRMTARRRLEVSIRKAVKEERKVFLVGHSMGSVIAYEVLRYLEQDFASPVVDHFVGMGSPMGFPFLTRYLELRHKVNRMPNTASRWSNLTDRRDLAAVDAHLQDDYGPNSRGQAVEDDLVVNSYRCPKNRINRHKAYGYLRAPELSRRLEAFLKSPPRSSA